MGGEGDLLMNEDKPTFETDAEEEAFNDVESEVSTGDRHLDNMDIWFAARAFFRK